MFESPLIATSAIDHIFDLFGDGKADEGFDVAGEIEDALPEATEDCSDSEVVMLGDVLVASVDVLKRLFIGSP